MTDRGHPIQVLCDAHIIPMLMFLRENGPGTKTEIYAAVGRNSNMPAKILRLVGLASGLLPSNPQPTIDVTSCRCRP